MAFTLKQVEDIKAQLIDQIDKLDNPNKEGIKKYLENLEEPELVEFLKKNNIKVSEKDGSLEQAGGSPEDGAESADSAESAEPRGEQCIFCSIVKGTVPSYRLTENNKSMAILEINPLSKGHSIILPKSHVTSEKLPKAAMSLAQKIGKKIKKKLKADDIKIETSSFQGHSFINIIPMYKDVQLKKQKAEEKELKEIQNKLMTKKRSARKPTEEKIKEADDKMPRVNFRVP